MLYSIAETKLPPRHQLVMSLLRFRIRRLQSRRALYLTPLSPLRRNHQLLPSRIEGKLVEEQQWPVWVILQDRSSKF
ncbi:hypothetical protein Bca4012_032150 [Brassica carinata]|uniref:Uncharacterized protein n=1 Tax=Brassica carinata TaxID=52824 RepID=A0A8X7UQN9_BRACI|nr:hypothetical protein Bca52824_046928 [Brassica carinata]